MTTLLENNRRSFLLRYPKADIFLASDNIFKENHASPTFDRALLSSLGSSRMHFVLGLGAHVIEMGQRIQELSLFFIIVERSWGRLQEFFSLYDVRPLIENLSIEWIIGENPDTAKQRIWTYFDSEARMMAAHSVGCIKSFLQEDEIYYKQLEENFSNVINERLKSIAGDSEDNYRGLTNILKNLKDISSTPLFDVLRGTFSGKPGVVISSGPSLTQSLPLLKKHQDQVVLFCVDSALTLLLKEGITPHFVACLERVPETKKLFEGMPELENTWLVANPLIVPETFEAYRGPKTFFLRDAAHLGWFFPGESIPDMGSSSAHMAYWGLHQLGCDPILLVGQDLAFDRHSTHSHASGIPNITVNSAEKAYEELRTCKGKTVEKSWIEGNDGKPILSWSYYIDFISTFERLIWKSGKKCINAISISYGAKIPKALRQDPSIAFETVCGSAFDPGPLVQKALSLKPEMITTHREVLKKQISLGIEYLKNDLTPKALDILHEISYFYQYHLPTAYRPSYEKEYFDFFSRIEKQDASLTGVRDSPYQGLMAPFTWFAKMDTVHTIAKMMKKEEGFEKKIGPVISKLQAYYRDILYWSLRSQHLFEKFNAL